MCLILIARGVRDDYPLILAANRDEFLNRPTAPLAPWSDRPGIVAGRDAIGRGTWLGATRSGRIAAVTNIREPGRFDPSAPSRGDLPAAYLLSEEGPLQYLESLAARAESYNGYNLIAGNRDELWYHSNRLDAEPYPVPEGCHGLSNDVFGTAWPKVVGGARDLAYLVEQDTIDVDALFEVLSDAEPAPDARLPDTGVGLERERVLSSRFIRMDGYGTRSSTVLLAAADGHVTMMEKTWPTEGLAETRRYRFRTHPMPRALSTTESLNGL